MATPTPWLSSFDVNAGIADAPTATDLQVIGLSNGNILVAWAETGTNGVATAAGTDIVGKIFASDGTTLVNDAFQLNSSRFGDDEEDFDIAPTNDGGFILVYVDNDSTSARIVWERKAANSTNIDTKSGASSLANPQVAINDNSTWVTYTETDPSTPPFFIPGFGIVGVKIDGSGGFLSTRFDAATDASGASNLIAQSQNDLAIKLNGEMVSVFTNGSEVTVEVYTTDTSPIARRSATVDDNGSPNDPQVTTLVNGNIVVVWTDDVGAAAGGGDVGLIVFDANLNIILGKTAVVLVNANEPEVVALPNGGFIIVWDDDSTANSIKAQEFDETGAPDGDIVTIGSFGGSRPNVGVTIDGRVLFVWDQGGDIRASIWDPRDGDILPDTYTNLPFNFVDETNGLVVYGNEFANTFLSTANNDRLIAGAGNDTFRYLAGEFSGADTLDGGTGTDKIELDGVGFFDFRTEGTQWVSIGQLNFSDTDGQTVSIDAATMNGQNGAPLSVFFGTGAQIPRFYRGNETALVLSDLSINGYVSNDNAIYIYGDHDAELLSGTNVSDFLDGNGGNDTIEGGSGNDELVGGLGNDLLKGEAGNDTLAGSEGKESLLGGGDDDSLLGGDDDDWLFGDGGNDSLFGDAGNDSLIGGFGNDTLDGSSGNGVLMVSNNDTLRGLAGDDLLIYSMGGTLSLTFHTFFLGVLS